MSSRPIDVQAWDAHGPEAQDRFAHLMANYPAVVAHLDTAIGRLVARLAATGQLENTVIMVMIDKGGSAGGEAHGKRADSHLAQSPLRS